MYGRNYYKQDPVLLCLSPATISALYDANIRCLEDLFTLDEDAILKISGIGPKRSKQIVELLYSLPFDYMDNSLPGNPEQDPHAGVSPELTDLLTNFYAEKILKRGLNYYRRGKVGQINLQDEETRTYAIAVHGTKPYTVTLKLKSTDPDRTHCTCPAFSRWSYGTQNCKHIYAAALALAEQQRLELFNKDESGGYAYKQLVRRFNTVKSNARAKNNRPFDYFLVQKQGQWDIYPREIYDSKSSSYNYQNYRWNNPWNELEPTNAKDRLIISYLKQIYSPEYDPYASVKVNKSFGDVLELLKDRPVYLQDGSAGTSEIHFRDQPFTPLLTIDRADPAPSLNENATKTSLALNFLLQSDNVIKKLNEVEVICVDPCWVCEGTTLARVQGSDLALQFFLNSPQESVGVHADEISSFLGEFYPTLQEAGIPVQIDNELTEAKAVSPSPRLYLHENGQRLAVELRVGYRDHEVQQEDQRSQLLLPAQSESDKNDNQPLLWSITRDIDQEKAWVDELEKTGLESTGAFRTFTPQDKPLEWVVEFLPELAEKGYEIYGEQLKRYAPPKKFTSSSLRVQSGEKWFELEGDMTFGDTTISMSDIRSVLINDEPYVRLQDGSTGRLPEDWLRRLKKLMHLTSNGEEKTRVPKMAASAIEELGEAADEYTSDASFKEYANRLRSFDKVKSVDQPEGLNGALRSYQLAGLSWMYFLHQYGFGGILADDMGLGKTVQALALLRKVHEESGKKPTTLVVAPRSVIYNWQAEINRFLPGYSVYIHHGADRLASMDEWSNAAISITTYATMRNDIAIISEKSFDYIILDESHTIRNPSSKTSQAIRRLKGDHRLCLTGTPVQNTTMDLWSQFEFLNPGLLGGQTRFRNEWVKPIEKQDDRTAEEMLHQMVEPFILRRTKQKVAKDLPPLTPSQVDCSMDATQQQVYEKYRQTYYQIVNEAIDEHEVQNSRFTVLEGLTRLRQICCSPRLLEGETGGSAKLKRFTELADELIREGHRALVFSQFVGFLRQIEAEVQKRGWTYEYLDGQTRNRQERVDRFQSDSSKKLFLISLKAGGEGLNLTGADYVFLMDPWWNPAAERQAMDRTHRIGQDEHVFVYRFVCPGTVEEKILRLQERKRKLAQKLIIAESGIFKQLNRDDLLSLFE